MLEAFQESHGITDMVVVADAGMLSAGDLQAIEDAGFLLLVGSRRSKAPHDLQEHLDTDGNKFST